PHALHRMFAALRMSPASEHRVQHTSFFAKKKEHGLDG
ncbi:MAG: hypothetical protein JWQ09_3802, partial [Segetibacter sp.]|nr:hypothetical protein [Segetibacter sp.]